MSDQPDGLPDISRAIAILTATRGEDPNLAQILASLEINFADVIQMTDLLQGMGLVASRLLDALSEVTGTDPLMLLQDIARGAANGSFGPHK